MSPLCFMVMPYGRKATQAEAGRGPGEIDFNALWDRAYVPVIKKLGYTPVRADQDVGVLIITQMLERLYFSDLVLADMTIANTNVYYEVGIRHAAQKRGCVLLAADWSKPIFDVAQMRTVRYPLPEGNIEATTAEVIKNAIEVPIARLINGSSPMLMRLPVIRARWIRRRRRLCRLICTISPICKGRSEPFVPCRRRNEWRKRSS